MTPRMVRELAPMLTAARRTARFRAGVLPYFGAEGVPFGVLTVLHTLIEQDAAPDAFLTLALICDTAGRALRAASCGAISCRWEFVAGALRAEGAARIAERAP